MTLEAFIHAAIIEDTTDPKGIIKPGDHSALACISEDAVNTARLIIKESGIVAGVEVAVQIFKTIDPGFKVDLLIPDGKAVNKGDIAFTVTGSSRKLLLAERLVLNIMQRMSGIATITHKYVEQVKPYPVKILDTRKTTPNFRYFEKLAVSIGGGHNHRFGLCDMIMLKDNHIDYCGSIEAAIDRTVEYLKHNHLNLKIEIETRNLEEVQRVLDKGKVHRIMLDNFSPELCLRAVQYIQGRYETEASGGITFETIRDYAATGVDFISVGALTHSAKNMDMSLKAVK